MNVKFDFAKTVYVKPIDVADLPAELRDQAGDLDHLFAVHNADGEQFGAFIEVHVATSIEECERRDRKGLYKLAREGKIKGFTGISDPYDVPENPELSLETENVDVDNCAHQILLKLDSMGLITG